MNKKYNIKKIKSMLLDFNSDNNFVIYCFPQNNGRQGWKICRKEKDVTFNYIVINDVCESVEEVLNFLNKQL